MKLFIKNNIKTFITILITTIVVGCVSVCAASQYFAKDINFEPANVNFKKENGEPIDNVEDALNELYEIRTNENANVVFISSAFRQDDSTVSNSYTAEDDGVVIVDLVTARGNNGTLSVQFACNKNSSSVSPVKEINDGFRKFRSYIISVKKGDVVSCIAQSTGSWGDSGYSMFFVK